MAERDACHAALDKARNELDVVIYQLVRFMKDGKPVMAVGSPGGSRIIGYVAKTIVAHLDWGMDVAQAVAMPHLLNRFGPFEVEADTRAEAFAPALEALGYDVAVKDMNSGLHAIAISTDGLSGGADPRREGLAVGR